MKKIINIIYSIVLIIALITGINVYAETPTLEQIANSFNNCNIVKNYAESNVNFNATVNGNKIKIVSNVNGKIEEFEYTLNDSILSGSISGTDERIFTGLIISSVLTDSIGQLHGYSDGEMFGTINSDEIESYTIEKEGLEAKKVSENEYSYKIDISRKIKLADLSDVYIKVSHLEDFKEYINGDGYAETSKGNVWFSKDGSDGENTVLVGEKNNLTINAYKSILSIIEVMFDSKDAASYFQKIYPEIVNGTKEFKGIKIEVNPTKTEFEESIIPDSSGYKLMRISINKDEYLTAMNNSQLSEEYVKVPNTSKNNVISLVVMGCILLFSGTGLITYILTKKENRVERY